MVWLGVGSLSDATISGSFCREKRGPGVIGFLAVPYAGVGAIERFFVEHVSGSFPAQGRGDIFGRNPRSRGFYLGAGGSSRQQAELTRPIQQPHIFQETLNDGSFILAECMERFCHEIATNAHALQ